jgi:aspartyl-tRNA(Asn)/glutamyl-tRNA(Gln) amidotransferase subunit A
MGEMTGQSRTRLEQTVAQLDARADGAIFTRLYSDSASVAADAADRRAAAGQSLGPLDGLIVSIKDLFDVAGETTTAGSSMLRGAPPAKADAPIVARLKAAGAVILGKTNMSEFAYSGLGLNPHWGTPGNAVDRTRVPGGSSSGAGVAAALGIGAVAIGTDTGGSVRIPASLNGVVGFKPSTPRVPRDGAYPLSYTLDSIGPLAQSVTLCAMADAVMAGEAWTVLEPAPLAGRKIAVVEEFLGDTEPEVMAAFEDSVKRLEAAGMQVTRAAIGDLISEMRQTLAQGPIVPVEAAAIHAEHLAQHRGEFDPQVLARILQGLDVPAARYVATLRRRLSLIAALDVRLAEGLLLAMPATPMVAPTIAEVEDANAFRATNALMLRNTAFGNFFDLCGISLPMPKAGMPAGLMLMGAHGSDKALLAVALAIEPLLNP